MQDTTPDPQTGSSESQIENMRTAIRLARLTGVDHPMLEPAERVLDLHRLARELNKLLQMGDKITDNAMGWAQHGINALETTLAALGDGNHETAGEAAGYAENAARRAKELRVQIETLWHSANRIGERIGETIAKCPKFMQENTRELGSNVSQSLELLKHNLESVEGAIESADRAGREAARMVREQRGPGARELQNPHAEPDQHN